jgi:hypothetical protein
MEGLDDTTYSGNKYRIKSVRKAWHQQNLYL